MHKRLLIVDDERDLTDALAVSLTADGDFEVSIAYDGLDGLRMAEMVKPDLILLDITMPVVDGWEMCRRLRDDPAMRRIPVVVLTAGSGKDLPQRAAEEGVSKVLLKPVGGDELLAVLRACA